MRLPALLALVTGVGLLATGRADNPPKKPAGDKAATVEDQFPFFNAGGAYWQCYADPRVLESFYLGKYSSNDPKAPPKYHVSLVYYFPEGAKAVAAPGYYGAADAVEVADGGLKISIPATRDQDAPARALFLTRKGEKAELRIPDGPGKGTYALELPPKLPARKTVAADFQETWGDGTGKQAVREFRFYPFVEPDKTGRPGVSYHLTLTPARGEPATFVTRAVTEPKDGRLAVDLPERKDGPTRLLLARAGDGLKLTVQGGPLGGEYALDKRPPFNPRGLFPEYQSGEWASPNHDPVNGFFLTTVDPGNGPPVARWVVSLTFKDRKAGGGYYGRAHSVAEDPKTGTLTVAIPGPTPDAPARALVLKRTGDKMELTVPDGPFKGTHTLEKPQLKK